MLDTFFLLKVKLLFLDCSNLLLISARDSFYTNDLNINYTKYISNIKISNTIISHPNI